jgi:5-methylcytosine-specific restriction enzyme subunit McrC
MRTVVVQEYGSRESISRTAGRLAIPPEELRALLTRVAGRAAATIRLEGAVQFREDTFRFVGLAGVLRIAPGLQLEIAPKFLDKDAAGWRGDFFALANLVKYGRILPQEAISASISEGASLSDLVGRAVVHLFDRHGRSPAREYRRREWVEFDVDGEVDPESLVLVTEDGFIQEGLVFDRANPTNRVLADAMQILTPQVGDPDLRRQLINRRLKLGDQTKERLAFRRRLPGRQRAWQDLYDLSWDILRGFGTEYARTVQQAGRLPGYLVRTEDAWENLLLLAVRAGYRKYRVTKRPYRLGARFRSGQVRVVLVTPDVSITDGDARRVLDAKYKTPDKNTDAWLGASDLYETLAFATASQVGRVVVLYPTKPALGFETEPGTGELRERVVVNGVEVIALTVSLGGLGQPRGFIKLSRNLVDRLEDVAGLPAVK